MKRLSISVAALAALVALAGGAAPAQPILYSFAGLRGGVDACKWFDDNLTDRSIAALTHQTDMLYNRVALPAGEVVTVRGTATTLQGEPLVDFDLHSALICTDGEAIYGPTPEPSASPTPMPAPT
ncbi:MAG TPA: hypothetical protein VMU38_07275 [Candidatus Binatia bacterium]|nr:hypothetical protein [Candidatus Binatia bacterium]